MKSVDEKAVGHEKTPEERLANLPAHLRLTPEQLARAAADNARALAEANHPFALASPHERARARGVREAEEWGAALAQIEVALANALKSGTDDEVLAAMNARRNALDHLSEAYAAQGRFDLAAAHAPDDARRKELEKLWHAVMRPDDEVCGEECRKKFDDDPTLLTKERVVHEVWSVKHNRVMPVVACHCGEWNARALPAEIGRQRAARSRARTLTEGLKPADAAETLRRARLTTREVFKA
jgi:hypothetical protein